MRNILNKSIAVVIYWKTYKRRQRFLWPPQSYMCTNVAYIYLIIMYVCICMNGLTGLLIHLLQIIYWYFLVQLWLIDWGALMRCLCPCGSVQDINYFFFFLFVSFVSEIIRTLVMVYWRTFYACYSYQI